MLEYTPSDATTQVCFSLNFKIVYNQTSAAPQTRGARSPRLNLIEITGRGGEGHEGAEAQTAEAEAEEKTPPMYLGSVFAEAENPMASA